MAISSVEYSLFRTMREQGALPLGADILELGEANWYGDVPAAVLMEDIGRFATDDDKMVLSADLERIVEQKSASLMFEIAKVWWRTFFHPKSMTAIDFHGTESALRMDLNYPVELPRRYGIVTNLGTSEHVFNIAQVFKSIHDYTLPGGLMIHGLPLSGWVDHGFYSFNSTFYWDLAQANQYLVRICLYAEASPMKLIQLESREAILELARNGQIGNNSLIYTVLRKPQEHCDFRVPIQGYYSGSISPDAAQAWKTLR